MTMKPIWLLDVDGVLNGVGQYHNADYLVHEADNGFRICYRPPVIERINALVEANKVEVHWLTTWRHLAPTLGKQLGLLPRINFVAEIENEASPRSTWWKSPRAHFYNDNSLPMIWTDDDLDWSMENDDVRWLDQRDPTWLLISPDTNVGLTDTDLDLIEAFCESNQAS